MEFDGRINGKRLVFSESTYRKISRILFELNNRLKAQLCIFADINGYAIDYSGDNSKLDISSFTAIAAGCFSTSNEMANMVGAEAHFQHLFHEGTNNNVYMCNVSSDYLMIVIFEKSVPIGLVRLFTHHTVAKLSGFLDSLKKDKSKISQFLDSEFRSKLDHELDKAFGTF